MLAFDLMAKGDLMSSNQVTKVNLINLIKILCEQLEWTEEEHLQSDSEATEDSSNAGVENNSVPTQKGIKNSQEICKFIKSGNCHYGRTGKKRDKGGKSCAYMHPPTCKKFELYGNKEQGCKKKNCDKLHLNLCKIFMKYKSCKYEGKCKYFHPKKFKNIDQQKPENQSCQQQKDEKPSYAQIVTRNIHPQSNFLGHHSANNNIIGQTTQMQMPFLESKSHFQQPVPDLQNQQKQILDLLVSLNQ